jgi:hypothetical protein
LCQIAPGFGSSARRIEGCISRYAAFNATQQMGQRPSKMVQLFFAGALKAQFSKVPCGSGIPLRYVLRFKLQKIIKGVNGNGLTGQGVPERHCML